MFDVQQYLFLIFDLIFSNAQHNKEFQFLLRQPHLSLLELTPVNTFNGIITASGAIVYAYEGQAVVLPLENKIKKPHKMLGFSGVISTGLSIVTVFYILSGFLGYITYGDGVKGSIALNLPDDPVYSILKVFLIIVVFTGFSLQQYVVIELTLPKLKKFMLETFRNEKSKVCNIFVEFLYRSFLVFVCMLIAITVPNLEEIIPLVGITCGMMIALVFPPIIDTLVFLPKLIRKLNKCSEKEKASFRMKIFFMLVKNSCLVFVGVFGLVTGLQASIQNLLNKA